MSVDNTNPDTMTLESAKIGDLEAVKKYVKAGGSVHLALIGASDHGHKEVCKWALDNGACLLFCIQQPEVHKEKLIKYNKPISMLKGPGEVKKGTFNGGGVIGGL
jgi:hypothetical protein